MSSKNVKLTEDQELAILEEWNKRDEPPYILSLIHI